jgi:hypothetical protein
VKLSWVLQKGIYSYFLSKEKEVNDFLSKARAKIKFEFRTLFYK